MVHNKMVDHYSLTCLKRTASALHVLAIGPMHHRRSDQIVPSNVCGRRLGRPAGLQSLRGEGRDRRLARPTMKQTRHLWPSL